jgi:hypothetical protein
MTKNESSLLSTCTFLINSSVTNKYCRVLTVTLPIPTSPPHTFLDTRETCCLKTERACFSETSVSTYQSTRRHNPEQHRHPHRRENLKSHIYLRCKMGIVGKWPTAMLAHIIGRDEKMPRPLPRIRNLEQKP